MSLLTQVLVTLVLMPISGFALKLALERYTMTEFHFSEAFKIAIPIELGAFFLKLIPVQNSQFFALFGVMIGGIIVIRHIHEFDWLESAKIFILWFVIRFIGSILIAVIPGVIVGLNG